MKKGVQRFAFLLLALYIISFLSITFVAAVEPAPTDAGSDTLQDKVRETAATKGKTVFERTFGPLGAIFKSTGGMSEDTKLTLSKFLLIFLVVIVVYAIAGFLPFFDENKTGLKWTFAIVIGILSFLFVKTEDVKVLVTNYSALGIAITSVIPLIIILTITYQMREKYAGPAAVINKVLLLIFLGFLLVQWYSYGTQVLDDDQELSALYWLYPLCAFITLCWLFWEGRIQHWMRRSKLEARDEAAGETVDNAIRGARDLAQTHEGLAAINEASRKSSAGAPRFASYRKK